MARKLFCELCPATYRISVWKGCLLRHLSDCFSRERFAAHKSTEPLPFVFSKHQSLIRRTLGNTQLWLQENKAVNLALAAPKVNGILIRPGETFSFWHLVGNLSARKGYKEGLTIENERPSSGVGGGMCQFTNLIHWMVLHSPLEIREHHHHDQFDLFPDYNRQVPFGVGTSIVYNYLDYRFYNPTPMTFQLLTYVTDKYLCGELRADGSWPVKFHIVQEDAFFSREQDAVYRNGKIYRLAVDKRTGQVIKKELLRENHARVMYDPKDLVIRGEAAPEGEMKEKGRK